VRTVTPVAPPYEVGACAYGPGAPRLLDAVTERIAAWDREMNGTGNRLWIEVHPIEAEYVPTGMVRVPRRYNQIIAGCRPADEHAG
jgi:protein-L-isoaspartate(D-aspartate) O-methyltransferase